MKANREMERDWAAAVWKVVLESVQLHKWDFREER